MSCGLEHETAVIAAHLQVEEGTDGILVTATKAAEFVTSDLLCTRKYKQRKWEKEVERGREWSFLASSSPPTSLSS